MSFRRCIQMVWVMVLLLASGACATFDRQPESKFSNEQLRDMGEKFLAGGALGQALKMLTEAENRTPNDPAIQFLLGRGYEGRGLEAQALEHYRKAVTLKPDYSDAHNALGAFYARKGDLYKAEEHFKLALGNPFYETPYIVHYNLGLLCEKRGETEEALARYQEAVRLEPNYGQAYYHIGLMLENLKRADEARDAYGKAIECAPDLVEAHFRYGVMSYMAGEMENAMYSLSRVVRLAPHTTMASDARKYLERLQGAMGNGASKSSTLMPAERLSHLDVMSEQDLQRREALPPVSTSYTQPAKSGLSTYPGSVENIIAPPVEPEARAEPPAALPAGTHWTYIVQLGSYLDKENAELMKQRLKAKGYNALVKPLKHQVLGQVFIVQLNPVNSEAKASTLMAQVEGDEKVKPIIIKVPASN